MTVPKERRVGVDTSVWVNVFTGGASDDPEWLEHSKWVLRAGQTGLHRVVVPALVIAEVAGCGRVRGMDVAKPDRVARMRLVKQWIREAGFLPVDIDERVAAKAADLAMTFQLRGPDAAVAAACLAARCTSLFTWDTDLLKLNGQLAGMAVVRPQAQPDEQAPLDLDRPE